MRSAFASVLLVLALAPALPAHFAENDIYVVDRRSNSVYRVFNLQKNKWDFGEALSYHDGLRVPSAIGFDAHGEMLIGDVGRNCVHMVYPSLFTRVLLTDRDGIRNPAGANALVVDGFGWLYVADAASNSIHRVSPDYTKSWVFADPGDGLVNPAAIAVLPDASLLVANSGSGGQVLALDPMGNASVFDTIPGENPRSIVWRNNRDVYVACDSGAIYRYVGGSPANRTLLGVYGGHHPSMAFDSKYGFLVHVNRGDGKVRSIHADTGAWFGRVNQGWDAVAVAVYGSQNPAGSYTEFGFGIQGAGTLAPELHGMGNPREGGMVHVMVEDFVGASPCLLFVGEGRTLVPFAGGEWYVDLNRWYTVLEVYLQGNPGKVGEGDQMVMFAVPKGIGLPNTQWYAQAMGLDPAAPQGVTVTPLMRIWIGD